MPQDIDTVEFLLGENPIPLTDHAEVVDALAEMLGEA